MYVNSCNSNSCCSRVNCISYFQAYTKTEVANHPIALKKKKGAARDSPPPGRCTVENKMMDKEVLCSPSRQAIKHKVLMLFHDFLWKSRGVLPLVIPERLGRNKIWASPLPINIQDHKFSYCALPLRRQTSKLGREQEFDLTNIRASTQVNRTWNYGDTWK